ncbi:MAG TPA: hypothetical protein VFE06_14050 [Acidobacteriaceae bacterium]|jgi:hypothetical protein|nr:hypothetical protein [Acidobacteriaceae bacterium]
MYYIGLDVHKKTISYCVKDGAGRVHQEGRIGATRQQLDAWIRTLPEPRTIAMEATIFTVGNTEVRKGRTGREDWPQGLKPISLSLVTARLKSCPDTKATE